MSRFIEELTRALETKRQLSTTYHPQTDKQTEKLTRKLEHSYDTMSIINKTIGQNS